MIRVEFLGETQNGQYTTNYFEGNNLLEYTTLHKLKTCDRYAEGLELKYVIQGQCKYYLDNQPVRLSAQQFCVINRGRQVKYIQIITRKCKGKY